MGNDDLTKYGDGWLAHWTSAAQPTLPTGWEESETKLWQTGVYPTYSWVEPVPGVLGTVDVDRWFGTEQDLRAYLGYEDVPVPPEPHSHPELQEQISVLSSQVASLQSAVADHEARLDLLEAEPEPPTPSELAVFQVTKSEGNTNSFHYRDVDGAGKPIMIIYEPRVQWHFGDRILVKKGPIIATGGERFYEIAQRVPNVSVTLYLRAVDGSILVV